MRHWTQYLALALGEDLANMSAVERAWFVAFRVDFRWARGADAYLREVSDAYAEAFEADW